MSAVQKKPVDFRMSKKVAELTQVVHMLFTRNHEKEVELEALRNSYEYEIEIILSDAKNRIDKIQNLLKEAEKQRSGDQSKLKETLINDHEQREQAMKKKIQLLEQQLLNEKQECSTARDMLINAQQDMERLKSAQVNEMQRVQHESTLKEREIERLKKLNTEMEKQFNESGHKSESNLNSLRKAYNNVESENQKFKIVLDETERIRDRLIGRNRQLENEVKLLKKELGKKGVDSRSARSSACTRQEYTDYSNASMMVRHYYYLPSSTMVAYFCYRHIYINYKT